MFLEFFNNKKYSDCNLDSIHYWSWNDQNLNLNKSLIAKKSQNKRLQSIGYDERKAEEFQLNINLYRYKDVVNNIHIRDLTKFDKYSDIKCNFIHDIVFDSLNNVDYFLITGTGSHVNLIHFWASLLKCSPKGIEVVKNGLGNKTTIVIEQSNKIKLFSFAYVDNRIL